GAALDDERVAAARVPEGPRVVRHRGQRHAGREVRRPRRRAHARSPRRRRSALVGIPLPLATRQSSASATWFTAVPRSCFTPSTTWLSPWTYASERLPPAVFVGSAPSGQRSAPEAAKGPLSPRAQKPKSSSWRRTM